MSLRIDVAQINPLVGDLSKNVDLIIKAVSDLAKLNTRIVLLPYNALSGYPLLDLRKDSSFLSVFRIYLRKLASKLFDHKLGGIHVVFVSDNLYSDPNQQCFIDICMGKVSFSSIDPVRNYAQFEYDNFKIAVTSSRVNESIIEYAPDIVLVSSKDEFLLDSDFNDTKYYKALSSKLNCTVIKANLAGATDYHIFPGASVTLVDGKVQGQALWFDSADMSVLFDADHVEVDSQCNARANSGMDTAEQAYRACLSGLTNYIQKNGFERAVIGLSGGIDSAVVAAMLADAIGADNVYAYSLPSIYSSQHSIDDAVLSVQANGFNYEVIEIWNILQAYASSFEVKGLVEENLQSRIRGNILMSMAGIHNGLVVATGNKSEACVGYFTMYGDSVGAYAPLVDCYKNLVWDMAKWRNKVAAQNGEVLPIPPSSITKAPSAELRPGQVDTDSLPQYNILDSILKKYIDEGLSINQIADLGYDIDTVNHIVSLVLKNEWKRHQYPIGPRISKHYLGADRNMPITNAWTHGIRS